MRDEARRSLDGMRTVVKDLAPPEFEALLERRRRLGRFDEMWEGVLHMNPAPSYEHQRLSQRLAVILDPLASAAGLEAVVGGVNIGDPRDYRIPDGSLHRPGSGGTYLSSAELVVEIVSPDDDTWKQLALYAAHQVDELLIVDRTQRGEAPRAPVGVRIRRSRAPPTGHALSPVRRNRTSSVRRQTSRSPWRLQPCARRR
jgi:Uma2 family endonuclease